MYQNFFLNTCKKDTSSDGGVKVAESELVGLATRVILEVRNCLTNSRTTLQLRQQQLVDKQLRSRQRDNLKKLLAL